MNFDAMSLIKLINIFFLLLVVHFYLYLVFTHIEEWMKVKRRARLRDDVIRYITESSNDEDADEMEANGRRFSRLLNSKSKRDDAIDILLTLKEKGYGTWQTAMNHGLLEGHLLARLASPRISRALHAIKLSRDLEVREATPSIRRLMRSQPTNVDLQYHGLLALAKLADGQGIAEYLHERGASLHLTSRALLEVFSAYAGEQTNFYSSLLQAPDDYVKVCAVKLIGVNQCTPLAERVTEYLNSPNASLRIAGVKAIGLLEMSHCAKGVSRLLEDGQWEVRAQAAKTLGMLRDRNELWRLERALGDKEWWVRYNAAWAVAQFEDLEPLIARVNQGDDPFAREMLAYALTNADYDDRQLGRQMAM